MTEKRFTETISTGIVTDNKTGIEYSCEMRIDDNFLNLVNTIAEENEQLKGVIGKSVIERLLDGFEESYTDLEEENEQLKSDLDYFKAKNGSLETGMFNLGRENGQLKGSLNFCTKNVKRLHNDKKELINENEQLKSVNQELRNELKFDEKMYTTFKEIIDEADDLIISHLSKHYQRKWKNFCKYRGVLYD